MLLRPGPWDEFYAVRYVFCHITTGYCRLQYFSKEFFRTKSLNPLEEEEKLPGGGFFVYAFLLAKYMFYFCGITCYNYYVRNTFVQGKA